MSAFTERLARANRMDPEYWIVDEDPAVVEIESESSDDEHTIVADVAFCDCEDRQYRQLPCKHLLFLATDVGDSRSESTVTDDSHGRRITDVGVPLSVRETTVSGIEHRHDQLTEEMDELEQRLAEVRQRQNVWEAATEHFDEEPELPDAVTESVRTIDDAILGAQHASKGARRDRIAEIADTAR